MVVEAEVVTKPEQNAHGCVALKSVGLAGLNGVLFPGSMLNKT